MFLWRQCLAVPARNEIYIRFLGVCVRSQQRKRQRISFITLQWANSAVLIKSYLFLAWFHGWRQFRDCEVPGHVSWTLKIFIFIRNTSPKLFLYFNEVDDRDVVVKKHWKSCNQDFPSKTVLFYLTEALTHFQWWICPSISSLYWFLRLFMPCANSWKLFRREKQEATAAAGKKLP